MDRKTFTRIASISFALLLSLFATQAYATPFTVTCPSGDPSSCSGGTSAAQDVTGYLLDSFYNGECSSGIECKVNGQTLTDGIYACSPGAGYCTNSLHTITCDPDTKQCTFSINTNECSGTNKDICRGLLPQNKLCELGLGPCSNNPSTRELFRKALESFCENEGLDEALCALTGDIKDTIYDALTPENLDAGMDSSQATITEALQYINNHLQLLRTGSIAYSDAEKERARQYYANQQWYNAYQQLAANDNTGNDAQPTSREATINVSADGKLSMYVNAAYLVAKQALSRTEGKSSTKAATLTVGADYRLTANTILGAALSFTDSQTKYGSSNSELDSQMFNLIAYSSFYIKQLWIDVSASYGINKFDQDRNIVCSGPGAGSATCIAWQNTYESDYDGSTASLNLGVGYDFSLQAWTLSPFIQWSGGQNSTDSYQETAATASSSTALLEIDKQKRYFSTVSSGTYIRYVINTKKAVLIPTLRLSASHELKDDPTNISGRLLGASNGDFVLTTNAADSTYATIGLGLSFQLQNGNSGFFDIETTEAYENLDQYKATFGWRWEF